MPERGSPSNPSLEIGILPVAKAGIQNELAYRDESKPMRRFCPNCGTKITEKDEN